MVAKATAENDAHSAAKRNWKDFMVDVTTTSEEQVRMGKGR